MESLNDVILEYINESGETANLRSRFISIAIAGLREMHMDFAGSPSVVTLPISHIDTVNLPKDYIKYTKIGVCDGHGELVQLGLNSSMALVHQKDDCGNYVKACQRCHKPIKDGHCGCDNGRGDEGWGDGWGALGLNTMMAFDGLTDNFRNGEVMGRFFGIGGGNSGTGHYKINDELGVMQISGRCGESIIMEYLADLKFIDGDFNVHPFIIQTIKDWISWRKVIDKPNMPAVEKQMREKTYWNSRRISIKRFNSHNLKEWLDVFRRYNTQSPNF